VVTSAFLPFAFTTFFHSDCIIGFLAWHILSILILMNYKKRGALPFTLRFHNTCRYRLAPLSLVKSFYHCEITNGSEIELSARLGRECGVIARKSAWFCCKSPLLSFLEMIELWEDELVQQCEWCEVEAWGRRAVVFDLISALILPSSSSASISSAVALRPFSVSSFKRSQFICMFIRRVFVATSLFC